jgi:hypothetical protein
MDTDPAPDPAPGPAPYPAIFVIDLQNANKNYFFLQFFCFSAYYSLKVHLHNFSKIKSHKKSQKVG